jgi:hypothetical protein
MSNLTLFQIAAEFRHITDVLMDSGCDEQTLTDTLDGEQWPLDVKAQQYSFVIRNLQSSAAAIKEAEAQMAARRKAIEKRADCMLERLKTGMEIAGVNKIECPHFAITIRKNPPSVDVFEPSMVPSEYWVQPKIPERVISKDAIKDAIKAGVDVPGALLVAGSRLDIK